MEHRMSEAVAASRGAAIRSGAAGVSGGTALVVFANSLPESNALKPWLLLAAPSLSIVVAVVWDWLQRRIADYARELEFRIVLRSARKRLTEQLKNNALKPDQRSRIETYLADLELMDASRQYQKVRALEIVTESTVKGGRRNSLPKGAA